MKEKEENKGKKNKRKVFITEDSFVLFRTHTIVHPPAFSWERHHKKQGFGFRKVDLFLITSRKRLEGCTEN